MEQTSSANDLFLQFVVIYIASSLDEEGGRRAATAYNDALFNEMSARFPHVFFD
jgi:hypothetical protein